MIKYKPGDLLIWKFDNHENYHNNSLIFGTTKYILISSITPRKTTDDYVFINEIGKKLNVQSSLIHSLYTKSINQKKLIQITKIYKLLQMQEILGK